MARYQVASLVFLCLWIILIPSSLAYHFNEQAGLVKGILVDYRIPTISGSAIAMLGFLFFLGLSFISHRDQDKTPFVRLLGKTVTITLLVSLVLQIFIGLFQFRFQRSLLGYLPLGEVSFSDSQVAKGTFFTGELYKLPYGTTAHPNVLAGFVVIAFLLLSAQRFLPINRAYRALLFTLTALVCFLTQSFTASLALGFGTLVLIGYGSKLTNAARIGLLLLPVVSFALFSLPQSLQHPNTSISRRAQLQQIALKMVAGEPVLGIGWNNFTALQEDYGYVPSTTRFLQPIHHSFLLLIVELGLTGWLINFLFHAFILRVHSLWLPAVAALVLISSFDHYPVTLTSGRMLLMLIILAVMLHKNKPKVLII